MEENSLRLILLGIGALILLAIYGYDFFKKKSLRRVEEVDVVQEDQTDHALLNTGGFSAIPADEAVDDNVSTADEKDVPLIPADEVLDMVEVPHDEQVPIASQAMVVQLIVLAKDGLPMKGDLLLSAFSDLGLKYDDMGIYHRAEQLDDKCLPLFYIANRLEPGTFPVGQMEGFESTELVLFFQTSATLDAGKAFMEMLDVAGDLSQRFSATLLSDNMEELSIEKISSIQLELSELA
ncbi:MAG: cell division protein ZipA C-terminal FtsZ-binding domain-containing protein [Cycloclasticus sp.]|nr:cell division protein ZipA C-terminal FtsZ-binding domain-containing protein [Cycloclasticus sp.]